VVRTPELVVARLHGLDAVASFGAVGRIPVLLLAVFQALLLPYWPALAEAVKLADLQWVRRVALRGLATILGIWLAVALVLLGFGQGLFSLWLGDSVVIAQPLIVAACGQSLGIGLLAWLMVLLNAQSRTGTLLVTLGVVAVVYVSCGIWLGLQHGPVGVAIGQIIGLCGVVVPTAAWELRKLMRAVQGAGPALAAAEQR
jgi:O-antigen/teichoic acid export membrane protein